MEDVLGRDEEIATLKKLVKSEHSEFLAIYGRRRVGKTYLIDQFFRTKGFYFHFTGMKDANLKEHLTIYHHIFCKRFLKIDVPPIRTWIKAFLLLRDAIDDLDKSQKIIIFFDEIPWIDTRKSGFLKALEHFWNDYFSRISNAILVVCGSAASWMIEKIVQNKGGLHNRLTSQIRLEPFSLKNAEVYLNGKNILLSRKHLTELYMSIGGVAKYLSYVEKGMSAPQIIQEICFKKDSPLIKEYKALYSSLFSNYQDHVKIVEILAERRYGLTHSQLLIETKKTSGGTFTKILEELSEAGFISFIPSLHNKKKEGKYFLSDEYSLFYLNWIKQATIIDSKTITRDYWLSQHGSAKFASWSGFAFETICRKHISQIIRALNLEVVALNVAHWDFPKKSKDEKGFQIDLIIDRADHCINLCEIKFYKSELIFNSEEAQKILSKRERFREITGTKKTLLNTLISVYGAKENAAYFEAFDNQLRINDLF